MMDPSNGPLCYITNAKRRRTKKNRKMSATLHIVKQTRNRKTSHYTTSLRYYMPLYNYHTTKRRIYERNEHIIRSRTIPKMKQVERTKHQSENSGRCSSTIHFYKLVHSFQFSVLVVSSSAQLNVVVVASSVGDLMLL